MKIVAIPEHGSYGAKALLRNMLKQGLCRHTLCDDW